MMDKAILFIIFNRPDTSEKVLDEIIKAKPRKLYIAGDGHRNASEKELVEKTRSLVKKKSESINCEFLFRDRNLGCKKGVIGAINWFFENENEGIILEDDCLPSPRFFDFCSGMLDHFRDDKNIMHIAGSNLLIRSDNNADYYFSRLPNIWGWATWKRAWEKYDPEMQHIEDFKNGQGLKNIIPDQKLRKRYTKLYDKIYHGVDTWDFQWTYSTILNDGICIIPNKNLITNIGFGNNATHSIDPENPLANLKLENLEGEIIHPDKKEIDKEAETKFLEITNRMPPLYLRVMNKLKKIKRKIFA